MVTLASFPLGFRFRPTDEELVTHYLKGKINGCESQVEVIPEIDVCKCEPWDLPGEYYFYVPWIRPVDRNRADFPLLTSWVSHYLKGKINGCESQVEVIPEIDVCKCEPWDLPGKSIIQSDDPEWFFFAPRDRKYPNGHRSNRATEAGYWKATGKDRTVKKRAPSGNMLIGMKKTLVFYRGRAPRGDRTGWIMHEYRMVDNEMDGTLSDKGSYVLCRLFNKPLEKSANSTNELEEEGFSPSVTKSSPGDTHNATAAEEQLDTAANQDVRGQDTQYGQSSLSPLLIDQVMGDQIISPKSEDNYSNISLVADSGVRLNTEDGITLDDIVIYDPPNSPPLFDKQSTPNDVGEDCNIEEFLNSVLHDPDEYILPAENPIIQKYSVVDCGINQMDRIYDSIVASSDPSWNENVEPNNEVDSGSRKMQLPMKHMNSNINSQLFSAMDTWESILRYSQTGESKMANDACAGESGSSVLCEGSFNVADSSTVKSIRDGGDACVRSGIQIRSRIPQNFSYANVDQGTATRRIRLLLPPQVVGLQSVNTMDQYSVDSESSSVAGVSNAKVELSHKDVLEADNLDQPADAKNHVDSNKGESCDITDGICSAQRATEITHFADEISLADEKPGVPDVSIQSKSELRQRKQNDSPESLLKGRTTKPLCADGVSAFKHVGVGYVLLVLLVIMFMVLVKYV